MEQLIANMIASAGSETLGLAESCTGGLAAATVTSIPGASSFLKGAVVAYDNEVKRSLLKVPQQILESHGAVSMECALFMALGVKKLLGVTVSGAITGVAGPTGGTAWSPVGTVYMGLIKGNQEYGGEFHFSGDRAAVQTQAAETLLRGVSSLLNKQDPKGFSIC